MKKYDFSGWATKNDIKCSDGRTIRKDAFKDCDGLTVPLVYQHLHDDISNVLGHALLENRAEGVYAYCSFNDTEAGKNGKEAVNHGDITQLSIYANKLKQKGGDVLHGMIREVSLVLSGANSGARIDYPILEHGDYYDEEYEPEEAIIYTGEKFSISHSEDIEEPEQTETEDNLQHSDDEKEKEDMANNDEERTVKDVFEGMTEEQQNVCYFMVGQALADAGVDVDDDEEDEDVKHNAFDTDEMTTNYLSHADGETIVAMAKKGGSLQDAMAYYADENGIDLMHTDSAAPVGGFIQTPITTGDLTVDALFPDYKDVRPGAPELVTSDQGWISTVLGKVHKSPISRIRTGQVDIREIDELRAKGYKKGNYKTYSGNFKLVRRTTDPQTIYVKNALHRDDIIDITDFDYVQYLYNIDKMMLNEELATAMLFGDGRSEESDDKIKEEHIRPIWLDDELYTIHRDLDVEAARESLQGTETDSYFGENYIRAEAMIDACLYSREKFKGTGTPDMFIEPHELNVMLLARDRNGRRIYSSKTELAAAFNVGNIYTVEQMVNKTRTEGEGASAETKKLLALIVNLGDYSLGATKGGEITHFTQFDIDFNQEKSLIETRVSGALTRIYSAIAIEEDVTE